MSKKDHTLNSVRFTVASISIELSMSAERSSTMTVKLPPLVPKHAASTPLREVRSSAVSAMIPDEAGLL